MVYFVEACYREDHSGSRSAETGIFGPFQSQDRIERCIIALASRPDVIRAFPITDEDLKRKYGRSRSDEDIIKWWTKAKFQNLKTHEEEME